MRFPGGELDLREMSRVRKSELFGGAMKILILLLPFMIAASLTGCTGARANSTASVDTGTQFSSNCLKEGELCNPLNDRCCARYYCPGGLAPTCARRL